MNSLASGTPITLYDNVFYTPLYTGQLIDCAHQLLDQNAKGIYHLTSSDRLSKYDFGMKLAKAFNHDQGLITRGAYNPDNGIPRPLDMSLSNSKLLHSLGVASPPPSLTTDDAITALKADETLRSTFSSIDLGSEEQVN